MTTTTARTTDYVLVAIQTDHDWQRFVTSACF